MEGHEVNVLLLVAIVAIVALAFVVIDAFAPGRNVGASFWFEPSIDSGGVLTSSEKCCIGGFEVYDCNSKAKESRCERAGGTCVADTSTTC